VRIAQEYGAPPAGSAFHARAEATSGKIFFQHDVNFHLQTLFPQKNYFALSISLLISKAITVAFDKLQPRIFALWTYSPLYCRRRNLLCVGFCDFGYVFWVSRCQSVASWDSFSGLHHLVLAWNGGFLGTLYVNSSDVLGFVGKDATLMGRTLIWRHARFYFRASHSRTQGRGILAGRQLERGARLAFYENSQQNGVSLP
jgi:hypothetical protein